MSPRIRTIKPEFWSDEKLGRLDPKTRLVFLGLISHADDYGRLVDSEKIIEAHIFPFTQESVHEPLHTLANLGRIARYETASGQQLIQIVHWRRHQKVDHPGLEILPPPEISRAEESAQPAFSGESREIVATSSRSVRATLAPRSRTKDPGSGIGERRICENLPRAGIELPPSAIQFLNRFYGASTGATPSRRENVIDQLRMTLTPEGASLSRAQRVRAASREHLSEACGRILQRPPKKTDAAIQWLLKDLLVSRGDYIAASERQQRADDEVATSAEARAAEAWIASQPELREEIERKVQDLPTTRFGAMAREIMRREHLLQLYRNRSLPSA